MKCLLFFIRCLINASNNATCPKLGLLQPNVNKLRQMTWNQVYRDSGLKWEKSLVSNHRPELMRPIRCVLPKHDEQRPIVRVNLSVF